MRHRSRIERQRRQTDLARRRVDVGAQRVADDSRLFKNLLGHEVAIVAFADQRARQLGVPHLAFNDGAAGVVDHRAVAAHLGPVAFLQIADAPGQRRQRQRVRAEIHRALAIADGERAAAARADHQIVLAGEDDGERERAVEPRQAGCYGLGGCAAVAQLVRDQRGDDLGVGVARKTSPAASSSPRNA